MVEGTQRRLAAIVAADVVGYSRLMEADEAGTLAAVVSCRTILIDPAVANHGGRIVKTMGDGLLLEFSSAVAAVEFAIAVQSRLGSADVQLEGGKPIQLRIGVHVGDIIIEDGDIFGGGVNVAARIEPLSHPDGISLSDEAYRQVCDRVDAAWTDGGEHQVKNISRPIRVWHWQPGEGRVAADSGAVRPAPQLPEKPSIAVLPFQSLAGDVEQEYFADGMTEDLITDLSKVSGLFIVARNSSMAFKGEAVDIHEASRRLGVRYLLEGSVRKAGSRVRINVRLVDSQSGGELWAERHDGTVENVFELQDDVSAQVVSALSVHLTGEESERLRHVHTANLAAYELFVRAKATPYPPVPERITAARELFEQVIEMDPEFAGGYAGVSWMTGFSAMFGLSDMESGARQAASLADEAVRLDDNFAWSHMAKSVSLLLKGEHEAALASAEQALARQPNDADSHAYLGLFLGLAGRPGEAVAPLETALKLNPQFVHGPYLNLLGIIQLLDNDCRAAVRAFEQNVARQGPVGPPALAWMAAAYIADGRKGEAERVVRHALEIFPAFRLGNWNFIKLVKPEHTQRRLVELMETAGLPS